MNTVKVYFRMSCIGLFSLCILFFISDAQAGLYRQALDLPYPLGVTVTTTPFLGGHSAWDARDLFINLPTMGEELRLLLNRQALENKLHQKGRAFSDRPVIALGGAIEGKVSLDRGKEQFTTHDIDLDRMALHILTEFSPWLTGLMTFEYDNGRSTVGGANFSRVSNSKVFLKRGFITLGNLNAFPLYTTIGQVFIPFGQYETYALTPPLTRVLGRTRQRALIVGGYHQGVFGSVYAYQGDTNVNTRGINQWGVNLGYEQDVRYHGHVFLGTGYISNIADSETMQFTGAEGSLFGGFGSGGVAAEQLVRRVPAVNFHASIAYFGATLSSEYVSSLRNFDVSDLSFNAEGARPSAWDVEGSFRLRIVGMRPINLSVAYSQTWQSLGLSVPRQRLAFTMSASLWKNSIEAIEYRQDSGYPTTDTGGGSEIESASPGLHNNVISMLIGVYF